MELLRGWLFDHLGLKFTALLLAVLVYVHVYTDRPATMVVEFPVEYTDLPDSLVWAEPAPAAIAAELSGTGKQLIGLRVREPRLEVSLAGAGAGAWTRVVGTADLPLPSGSDLVVERFVGEPRLAGDLDHRLQRDLPVALRVLGAPAPGFAWSGAQWLEPAVVRITGPARVVARLDSVRLAPLQVAGRRDTVSADLAPDSLAAGCRMDPTVVRAKVLLARTGG
jgi:hypothetical protein